MKKCSLCGEIKSLEEFNRKGLLKSGEIKYQSLCRVCNSIKCRDYYSKNKNYHLTVIGKNKKRYRLARQKFIREVKRINGCIFCDEKEICCLDFHHLHSKDFLLSSNKITSIEKIKRELSKCVCLCSNCHRKVHNNLLFASEEHLCKLP